MALTARYTCNFVTILVIFPFKYFM
uniref:Uncharacterized protein n=1 Tax=Rhodnius prolixus TaxID=13249 RepID=T1HJ49_RHOPR